MRVLGIESSCDETSAAVVSSRGASTTLDSLVILSQDVHAVFGGVVPEIASRAHLAAIAPVVKRALSDASCTLEDVDAIGVTNGPGLVGALLVGVSFAKSLAASLGVPVIGVNHLEGHLFATALESPDAVPPFTALLVSGGHTMLLDVPEWGDYRLLGATRDDAAGEAFDKTAKLLGLPYPGGRHIEALAGTGDPSRGPFSATDAQRRPASGRCRLLRRLVQRTEDGGSARRARRREARHARRGAAAPRTRLSGCARRNACREDRAMRLPGTGARAVVLGGGVACNAALVTAVRELARAKIGGDAVVFAPSPRLATDNAAMIARAALYHLARGERSELSLNAFSSLPLTCPA